MKCKRKLLNWTFFGTLFLNDLSSDKCFHSKTFFPLVLWRHLWMPLQGSFSYLDGWIESTLSASSRASTNCPHFRLQRLRFRRRWTESWSKVVLVPVLRLLFPLPVVVEAEGIRRSAYWYLWAASLIRSFLNRVLPSSNSLFRSRSLKLKKFNLV